MTIARANDIDIAYETFGDRAGRPLVLIMGLTTQMIGWPERFCRQPRSPGRPVLDPAGGA